MSLFSWADSRLGRWLQLSSIELQKVIRSVQEKWYSLGTSRSSLPAIKNPHSENPYLPFQDTSKANQVIKLNMENVSWNLIILNFSALDSPRIQKHLPKKHLPSIRGVGRFEVAWRMRRQKSTSLPEGPAVRRFSKVRGCEKTYLLRYVATLLLANRNDRLKSCGS